MTPPTPPSETPETDALVNELFMVPIPPINDDWRKFSELARSLERRLIAACAEAAERRTQREGWVMTRLEWIKEASCPKCDGSGFITNTGPDPQHDPCEWCMERDILLSAAPKEQKEKP